MGHNSRLNSTVQHLQSSAFFQAVTNDFMLFVERYMYVMQHTHGFVDVAVSTKSMFDFVMFVGSNSCHAHTTLGDISKHMYWKF